MPSTRATRNNMTIINMPRLLILPLLLALFPTTITANTIPFFDNGVDPNFLMLGNSYTAYNSLADVLGQVIADGVPQWRDTIFSTSRHPPGRTLGAHWGEAQGNEGKPLEALLAKDPPMPWKWVVLQDQSQVPGFYQWDEPGSAFRASKDGAIGLNNLVKDAGGQTMFFMTWGRRSGLGEESYYPDFLTHQNKLQEGYRRYKRATSTNPRPTYIAPVGLVFKTIYYDEIDLGNVPDAQGTLFRSLYVNDGSHPSELGTYVAALTIYTSMTGQSPQDINYFPPGVDQATGRILQYAVSRTILETFQNGEIDYPWTQAFPAGTSSPALAAAPTTPPPTTPPPMTPAPAPLDNGNNANRGSVTVTIEFDEFPDEISWTFFQQSKENQPLYFQEYDASPVAANETLTKTFNNLLPGSTYIFKISDVDGDGICCEHGQGKFSVKDNEQNGKTLYSTAAQFNAFFELHLDILPNGHAKRSTVHGHYRPGTWDDLEDQLVPANEPGWPGSFPSDPLYSLVINMDLDMDPEQVSWTLYWQNKQRQWQIVDTWTGSGAASNGLESTEFSTLNGGWYKLHIQDSGNNGICCGNGRGYVSLTGPLYSQQGQMGLVWGNNGDFLGEDVIYFRMDGAGTISHVTWNQL